MTSTNPDTRRASEPPHSLSAEEVCAVLNTSALGLSSELADARLARFGRNEQPVAKSPGLARVFLRQFLNPLIYVLLAATAISAIMRDWSDAGFILAVLVLNAVFGCVQEYSAEKSAQALRALSVARAYVLRDGEDHEIDPGELVPGDVVLLEAGSKVPADVRLLQGAIVVDESILTGESLAVTKTATTILPPATALGDRANMAFAATMVTHGRGHGVVIATGLRSQIGQIASALSSSEAAKPPLLVRMEDFTRKVAMAAGGAVVALGAISIAQGSPVGDVLMVAVALAVAVIPEGLPIALTVALSIGARRMAKRKVIARRLVAVEALGSCTFIASDKTGTLTINELTVRKVLLSHGVACEITGQGAKPEGKVVAPESASPLLARLGAASVLCNDGFLGLRDGVWVYHGDAVDVALLSMAAKAGVHRSNVEADSPRVGEIPFDPEHRFAATLHRSVDSMHTAVKGAGERVLPMCSRMATPSGDVPIDVALLEQSANRLAAEGFRVLAIAAGPVELAGKDLEEFAADDLVDLVFLGFVGMLDPLRSEARESVRDCQAAGIQVAMVTGDHPVTALAIARELGFANRPDEVVTGPKLQQVAARGEAALDGLVRKARVFARVEPKQKLQIVQSLIRLGHFVAVTGDGANDASALRAAHIGVAMGERGTDVARESSDLILTDDNFASIVSGIEEGRIAYGNVRKVIFLLISSGAAEVLLFVMTMAAGLPLPLWPVQLLWLNLVTNGIQDVALAFEPGEGGELKRPPRSPQEPIFDRLMIERTLVSALVVATVGFGSFRWMLAHGWPLAQAQSGVLLLLVFFENLQAGNSRSESASLFTLSPMRNRLLFFGTAGAQLVHIAAIYTPGLREVLHLHHITPAQWFVSLGLALSLFVISELHKVLIRWRIARADS